jgi:hypothetical protein
MCMKHHEPSIGISLTSLLASDSVQERGGMLTSSLQELLKMVWN